MNSDQEEPAPVESGSEARGIVDYEPMSLPSLIGLADLVIVGQVTEVSDSTFDFQVDEVLVNEYPRESIIVAKFSPPEIFAPRAMPYTAGQRFVLFLEKSEGDSVDLAWKVLGFAGEGEMPVENGFVYFAAVNVRGLERKQYEVHGVTRFLQRFSLDNFCNAVKDYRECFVWKSVETVKNKKTRIRWIPSLNCGESEIQVYEKKSWIHNYLAENTLSKMAR